MKHKSLTGSTVSVECVSDDWNIETMFVGACKSQLVRSACVWNEQNSGCICGFSMWICVAFNSKDLPLGYCFFTVYLIPNLVWSVVNIESKVQFHLSLIRDFEFWKNSIQQCNIFFLHESFFKLFIDFFVCFLRECKNHDSGGFHVQSVNCRLLNATGKNFFYTVYDTVLLVWSTSRNAEKSALLVDYNYVFVPV